MAIIRIKRTTSSTLPTGLTFGELAYVQGSGGYTANRLYVANNAGVCVWIGAEILNSPTYWSGATAETTVPTVSAASNIASAFAGTTVFPSNITLNLASTKSFGKYVNGDVIQSAGKTPIEVITDALVESLLPTSFLSVTPSGSSILFGSTALNNAVNWGYTINTPGKTATGATLEWKRPGVAGGAYQAFSGTFYSDTATKTTGFTGGTYAHEFTQTRFDTNAITYKYTVRDSGGAGATYTEKTVTPQNYAVPTASVTSFNFSISQAGDTVGIRERGNTGSTLSATLSIGSGMNTSFMGVCAWGCQYQINSGTWYDAGTNTANSVTYYSITTPPPTGSTAMTIAIKPVVNQIDNMSFRFIVKDSYNTNGYTLSAISNTISFRKKFFYGATSSVPTTAAEVRTMPGSTLAPTNTTGHTAGQFSFGTGTTYRTFVIAIPAGYTLNDKSFASAGLQGVKNLTTPETLYGNDPSSLDKFTLSTGVTLAEDFSGTKIWYNVYTYTADTAYNGNQDLQVNYTGRLDNTNS